MSQEEDEAGPLIGWSLGTGVKRRPLDELVKFPCTYTFKAVGIATPDFLPRLLQTVGDILNRPIEEHAHSTRQSANGKYLSVTLELFIESSDQAYTIYESLSGMVDVKYVL